MTATPDFAPLKHISQALSGLVAAIAPSIVAVHSHRALSSGFVWKPGLIVTVDETLAEEGEVSVTLSSGHRVAAAIAGRDPTTDLALLRADTADAPVIALEVTPPAIGTLSVSVGARDGSPVAALGLVAMSGPAWRSMRGGEISARVELDLSLRREAEGGVAVDDEGRAFGMTVFGPRRRVLVIPAATIERVAGQLNERGKVARGYLGLGLQPVRLDRDGEIGAMVMTVDADGPGAEAGVCQGEVITGWDGKPIGSAGVITRSLGPASVGKTVALTLSHAGETRVVSLVIGERP